MRTFTCAICGTTTTDTIRPAWCQSCHATGTMNPPVRRPVGQHLAAAARKLTAREIVQASWDVQLCSATGLSWTAGSVVLLYGLPGSGKSTLALQLAAQVTPVLVCSLEEAPGPLLARRLSIAGMGARTDVEIATSATVADLTSAARAGAAVVIDSVSHSSLLPADLTAIATMGSPLVIGVLHSTKSAGIKGDSGYGHGADLVLRVEPGGRWIAEKTRFGASGVEGWVRGVATAVAPQPTDPPNPEVTP